MVDTVKIGLFPLITFSVSDIIRIMDGARSIFMVHFVEMYILVVIFWKLYLVFESAWF